MQLRGLRTGQLYVDDVGAARDWYTDLLGVGPYFDEPFYVGFDIGGYEFGLISGEPGRGAVSLWATEDPAGFLARALEKGASTGQEVMDTGDGIVVASFIDPFGNEFGLIRNPHFAPHVTHTGSADMSERVISYSLDLLVECNEAWDLWASSDGLARWWTPDTRIDLRPGGAYEVHFMPENPPGDRGGDWCRVLSFLPGRMLSFTWNAPPTLKTRPLQTWVVLLFEPLGAGCRFSLNHLGWPQSGLDDPESDWEATFEYFTDAWHSVIDLFRDNFSK